MPDPSLADLCFMTRLCLVLINHSDHRRGALRIVLDDEGAGRKAYEILAGAGCRRPALATSRAETPSIARRERGFIEAAGPEVIRAAIGSRSSSYETGLALGTELFGRAKPPDGVFCTTDLIACGLMDIARYEFGLRIPEDVCVIGFDEIEQAGWEAYKLTTFAQPVDAMADVCKNWLCSGDTGMQEIRISAGVVWRGSVRGSFSLQ